MTAADANILVRCLIADDARQTPPQELFWRRVRQNRPVGTAWVLRKTWEFEETGVVTALTALLCRDRVYAEGAPAVTAGAVFASFDKALVRRATRAGVAGVSMVLPA